MDDSLLSLILLLLALWLVVWLYILLPAGMARRRGRSELGWVLVSLIFSPLIAVLLLLLLGRARW